MNQLRRGFTIVELLIVIVVIAILASISVVAYNGVQTRAQNAAILSGAKQFENALYIWASDNGQVLSGGHTSSTGVSSGRCNEGAGAGYVGTGTYICTIEDTLVSSSLLPRGFTSTLPRNQYANQSGQYSIMIYKCGSPVGQYALFWTLRNGTVADQDAVRSIITQCGTVPANVAEGWGMRAGKIIQL